MLSTSTEPLVPARNGGFVDIDLRISPKSKILERQKAEAIVDKQFNAPKPKRRKRPRLTPEEIAKQAQAHLDNDDHEPATKVLHGAPRNSAKRWKQ